MICKVVAVDIKFVFPSMDCTQMLNYSGAETGVLFFQ